MTRFQDLKSECLHRSDKDLKPKQSIVQLGDNGETLKIGSRQGGSIEIPLVDIEKMKAKDLSESNDHGLESSELFILSVGHKKVFQNNHLITDRN